MEIFSKIFGWFQDFLGVIYQFLLSALPDSPFRPIITYVQNEKAFEYLNYFISFKMILGTMVTWVSAIALYYLYSVIMRWIKVIGD